MGQFDSGGYLFRFVLSLGEVSAMRDQWRGDADAGQAENSKFKITEQPLHWSECQTLWSSTKSI